MFLHQAVHVDAGDAGSPGSLTDVVITDDGGAELRTAIPEASGGSTSTLVSSAIRDITDRKRAEGVESGAGHDPGCGHPGSGDAGHERFRVLGTVPEPPGNKEVPVIVWTAKDLTEAEATHLRGRTHAVHHKATGGTTSLVQKLRRMLPGGLPARPEG